MAKRAKAEGNDGWVRPAHSAFEAPTIGQVVERKVGDVFFDRYGNTRVATEGGGSRIIKEA